MKVWVGVAVLAWLALAIGCTKEKPAQPNTEPTKDNPGDMKKEWKDKPTFK